MSKNILLVTNKIKNIQPYLKKPKNKISRIHILTDEIKIHEKFSLFNCSMALLIKFALIGQISGQCVKPKKNTLLKPS